MTTRTQDPWSSLFPSCLLSFFCISNFSPAVTEVHNPSKRCNHKSFMPPLYPICIFIQYLSLSNFDLYLYLQLLTCCHKSPRNTNIANIALWNKSNGSYDIKDFGTLPLIFSTSKYFRRKFQPCPSFFSHPNIPDK